MYHLLSRDELRIEKTTVVTFYGKKYSTAKGFASMLADRLASGMMFKFHDKGTNPKKYGAPYLAKCHAVALRRYNENCARLRAKAYRRIFPIVSKLWN
jgi:hypothetical protein